MVSEETQIVSVFVVLGVVLWYGSTFVTDSRAVQFVALVGVGVIVPTVINEWRSRSGDET